MNKQGVVVPILRFTYDTWKTYFSGIEDQWEDVACPYSIRDSVNYHLSILLDDSFIEFSEIDMVRIITIDHNFLNWLGRKREFISMYSLHEKGRLLKKYCKTLSDEDLNQLMSSSEMNKNYAIYIQKIYIKEKGLIKRKINNELYNAYLSYLEQIFGKSNVFFPGIMVKENEIQKKNLYHMADVYFNNEILSKTGCYCNENFIVDNENYIVIPFVVKGNVRAVIDLKSCNSILDIPSSIIIPGESFNKTGIPKLLSDGLYLWFYSDFFVI